MMPVKNLPLQFLQYLPMISLLVTLTLSDRSRGPRSGVSRPRADIRSRLARARIGSIGIFFSTAGAGAVLGRAFAGFSLKVQLIQLVCRKYDKLLLFIFLINSLAFHRASWSSHGAKIRTCNTCIIILSFLSFLRFLII